MYIDTCRTAGKYVRHLLRESFRENGKVKHRTVANISSCSPKEIEAIRLALRHKDDLASLISLREDVTLRQGLSVGAVGTIHAVAKRLGIVDALGPSRQGKLALWQVIARVIAQGSRLAAVRLAGSHAACDILGLGAFCEDDLYADLDWLADRQAAIEDRLFAATPSESTAPSPTSPPAPRRGLFLYDVTSTYLEGVCNAFGAFGYNRDGKRGKRQIVIGLLCDADGQPLSIEVFPGNTPDPATVASQIKKMAARFGGGEVTLVGDRGMLKSRQVEDLLDHGMHYITAITKPQIETLLREGLLQMGLFDQDLAEVKSEEGVRYVLRRNPVRAAECRTSREEKLACLTAFAEEQTLHLAEHPHAWETVALRKARERCERLKLSGWVGLAASERRILVTIDEAAREEAAKLDGCYVLRTDLDESVASKETVHARYKDLARVEWAFRTSKTVLLEMRPVCVRLAGRTRGHAFVVMLAYRIARELAHLWRDIDLTVEEGIRELSTLCAMEMRLGETCLCHSIPEPRASVETLLRAARVRLPEAIGCSGIRVATRKKLTGERKTR